MAVGSRQEVRSYGVNAPLRWYKERTRCLRTVELQHSTKSLCPHDCDEGALLQTEATRTPEEFTVIVVHGLEQENTFALNVV
uniref:Uncharacterized protein n=1 Tax=Anguilla anguilla TaxID=7936 RepID=A0A0E9WW87_ANGAN